MNKLMHKLKPLERAVKAMVLRLFFLLVRKSDHHEGTLDLSGMKKILIIRPEKIGDMFVSLPLFDALKARHPQLEIYVLASPRNVGLIKHDPRFAGIFLYRKNARRDLSDLNAIRRIKFDCVVDMICSDSVTALFLTHLCARGVPTVAMGKTRFREYYNFNFTHPLTQENHVIDHTLYIATAFGMDPSETGRLARPYVSDDDLADAKRFYEQTTSSGPRIGVNLSAGAPSRFWGVEKSTELIRRILAEYDQCTVYIITAPRERNLGEMLLRSFDRAVHLIPPGRNLVQVAALLSQLDVFISPDTSLIHIARSFTVPVVGLYRRFMNEYKLWRPYGQEAGMVLAKSEDDVYDITVEQVYHEMQDVFREFGPMTESEAGRAERT
ncbi:MAG: glycosyltransferase family 9 protein [candidate division Zixibacteria bacterium]|nr:glycosyltransferase family 9 protein [candidate division Zixibacteria bacterium]